MATKRKRQPPKGAQRFARALRRRMIELGWTPADLARNTGLQAETVRSYLRGYILPSRRALNRLELLMGAEVGRAVDTTALSGARQRPVEVVQIASDKVLLHLELLLSVQTTKDVLEVLRRDGVLEPGLEPMVAVKLEGDPAQRKPVVVGAVVRQLTKDTV